MADYAECSLATGGRFTLTLLLGVIPCEYRHKWYTAENYILRATFHSQNVLVYLQPLLRTNGTDGSYKLPSSAK